MVAELRKGNKSLIKKNQQITDGSLFVKKRLFPNVTEE